jgi:hypothetical protein
MKAVSLTIRRGYCSTLKVIVDVSQGLIHFLLADSVHQNAAMAVSHLSRVRRLPGSVDKIKRQIQTFHHTV